MDVREKLSSEKWLIDANALKRVLLPKGVVGVRNGESVQFQSVKDAAIAVNGARANITRSCNSKTRKAYGYKWMWAGERKEGNN